MFQAEYYPSSSFRSPVLFDKQGTAVHQQRQQHHHHSQQQFAGVCTHTAWAISGSFVWGSLRVQKIDTLHMRIQNGRPVLMAAKGVSTKYYFQPGKCQDD
jgi:hypothetical protein